MGKQRAKIISKAAFEKAFVEGEVIMRRNLARLIEDEYAKGSKRYTNIAEEEAYNAGLRKAQEIVFGKVERNEP